MLNADVHNNYTNHQYQTLVDPATGTYETRSECSIFFEVDGPYRAMILPASMEEGRLLKKRYAVFNFDGSLAELKGFELKRRGELEIIKSFQSQVFERFLDGDSLSTCYDSVASVANHWMDVLDTRGDSLETDELFGLISENKNMSRQLEDYGSQKGTSLTTAKRLAEFLGAEIVKDKGLQCKFIIAEKPHGSPVTDRAIPVTIWKSEPAVMKYYLRKWLKTPELEDFDIRSILDWEYYRDRLSKTIQKIITIPAALQEVPNPVPRVKHPSWLERKVRVSNDKRKQVTLRNAFASTRPVIETSSAGDDVVDIEDAIGGPQAHRNARALVKQTPGKVSSTVIVSEEEDTIPRAHLSNGDDFQVWLAQKKKLWRSKRAQRKRASNLASTSLSRNTSQTRNGVAVPGRHRFTNVQSYLRTATEALMTQEWQVIEIRETDSPGSFIVWMMVDSTSIQKISVKVPRVLYVNCREENIKRKKVIRHLPHSRQSLHLYEVSMDEYQFQRKRHDLAGLSGSNVESVYELETPLAVQSLIQLGSISRVSKMYRGESKTTFKLQDLEFAERPSVEYLGTELNYRRIFLHDNILKRTGLAALFIMEDRGRDPTRPSETDGINMDATVHIWAVKPGENQRSITTNMCKSVFAALVEQLREVREEYTCIQTDCNIRFSVQTVRDDTAALQGIQAQLTSYVQEKNGPTFLLIDSARPSSVLRKNVPAINDLPVITMKTVSTQHTLPALNWESIAVQLCGEAYFHMGAVIFPRKAAAARYANIPIGNLGSSDESMTLHDIFFARQLRKSRALLWASEGSEPDLGSSDMDHSDMIWAEEVVSPILREKGAYRSMCVQLDIHFLSVAALLNSIWIQEHSHQNGLGAGMGNSQDMATLGDEMACLTSIQLLRAMVQEWYKEALDGSVVADDLLQNFYRNVSSPQSLLYDPAIHRVLHGMMRRTFNDLLEELKQLGVFIVYASFSHVTIATNKTDLLSTKEYAEFIISTIKKREKLGNLDMSQSKYWSHFMFLDENNFGGMEYQMREPESKEETEWVVEMEGNVYVPTTVGGWNMMQYLASEIQQNYFQTIIGRFSREPWKKQRKLCLKCEELQEQISSSFAAGILAPQSTTNMQNFDEQLLQFQKKTVAKHFAFDITRMVGEVMKDGYGPHLFPVLPGSHLKLNNPPLEFVKSILAILQLDKEVETEVHILKKSLLAQVGCPEYSEMASWVNPCATYILPDVFCSECHGSRDVNLCISPLGDPKAKWECEDCGLPYNTNEIEWRLVESIQRKSARYQLQDLRCNKTHAVSTKFLSKQSEFAMELQLDISPQNFEKELKVLHNLAKFHDLMWLEETTFHLLGYSMSV